MQSMIVAALLMGTVQAGPLKPPMHRVWTAVTGEGTEVLAVRDGVVYYSSRLRAGALRAADGSVVWEKRHPEWTQGAEVNNGHVVVLVADEKRTRLVSYDLLDGTEKTVRELPEGAESFALMGDQIFLQMPGRKVISFDLVTGKQPWESTIGDGKSAEGVSLDALYLVEGVLVAALDGIGWQCLDPSDGRTLWKIEAEFATNDSPRAIGDRLLLLHPSTMVVEPRTGRVLWSNPDLGFEQFGVAGDTIIAESGEELIGVSTKDGSRLWSLSEGEEGYSMGSGDMLWFGDKTGVTAWTGEFLRITSDGQVAWRSPVFFDGYPMHLDERRMVTTDGDRILSYEAGPYEAIPDESDGRRAFVARGIANFESLDHTEVGQIEQLGEYSAEPLIRKYVDWAKAQQADYDDERSDDELGMLRYGLLQSTARTLYRICGREHTAALKQAIADVGPKNSYRDALVSILGEKGDPDEFIDQYISDLRSGIRDEQSRYRLSQTLDSVANSSHPSAVAFMLEVLRDARFPDEWRHEAFINLPRTGGEIGVSAVLALRSRRGPRPRWESLIDVSELEERMLLSEKQDAKGRTWRLFHSGVLGSYGDLFIVVREATGWGTPLFVGVSTQDAWTHEAPKEFRGVPIGEFVETEWIKVLPDDPSLRKDSDSDGLTDIVEKRYGTHPNLRDSDKDGLFDAVDPCPNAAPRTLGDKEKIIAACVEARFFAADWGVPTMISVDGTEPFEMYGYPRALFWETDSYNGELPKMYNTGVNMLNLRPIRIAPDGRSATTLISRYSGGLNGDGIGVSLIKIGDEWVVTKMQMEYVS